MNSNAVTVTVLGPWSDGAGPLHTKLADALRRAIELGHLASGARLPSERDLARDLNVSRSTVVAAYDTLRGEGMVESRQGSGTRVRARRAPGLRERPALSPLYRSLLEDNGSLISLALAIHAAHPLVGDAIAEVAADSERLLAMPGYLPAGLPELRAAIALRFTALGAPTAAEEILVTTGAQQAVNLGSALLLRPGDEVAVETPGLAGTLDSLRAQGARFLPIAIDRHGIDTDALATLAARRPPALVYVMPTYHNPTGVLLAEHRRRALVDLAVERGVPVLEDNALEFLSLDHEPLPPVAAFAPAGAPVLTAGSLSKAAWAGLRIGWLRGPARLIARAAELKAVADLGTPLLDQAVAARLVPRLAELGRDRSAELRAALELVSELLRQRLPDWAWEVPAGGPSLWIRLPSGTASGFAQVAARYGVEVIPGEVMSPTGEHRSHFRLPFTAPPPVLEATIARLETAWAAYTPGGQIGRPTAGVVV